MAPRKPPARGLTHAEADPIYLPFLADLERRWLALLQEERDGVITPEEALKRGRNLALELGAFISANPLRRPRGRPPKSFWETKPNKKAGRGRPRTITAENEAWFVREIDRVKANAAAKGDLLSDARALRASMVAHYFKRYMASGMVPEVARRLAKEKAHGPLFRTRRVHLARLRSQRRKQRG